MKNILILTASTGGGHNEAASNLKIEFNKYGYKVEIMDVMHLLNKTLDSALAKSFDFITFKTPNLYGKLYSMSEGEKSNKLIAKSILMVFGEKIHEIILEKEPDLIISTHALLINIVGYLKEEGYTSLPFIAVVTDYEAHEAHINKNVDAYIAANEYVGKSLANKGVSPEKIFPFGMPIKDEFLNDNGKMHSRNKDFKILVMAGSLGLKSMKDVLESLMNIEEEFKIITICGHNEKLKKTIENEFASSIDSGLMTVYGFTDNIPALMDECNLLITKPGGLTISEAIAKGIPMIIPYYIPGQEKYNLDYLIKENIAIYIPDIDNLFEIVRFLMNSPETLEAMSKKMYKIHNKTCINDIIYLSEKLIDEYYEDNIVCK